MANIIQIIKQAAMEAVEASKPLKVVYGAVVSVKPLKIKIDQKITLTEEFLVLSSNVTDYETEFTVDGISVFHTTKTNPVSTWADAQKIKVHNALKVGEKVILLQEQGGQSYVVIDRIGG